VDKKHAGHVAEDHHGVTVSIASTRNNASLRRWLYLRVMRAYGNRLQELLSKKLWHGAHGFSGQWRFRGEPFSMNQTSPRNAS
jgi:hypothetical protein